MFVRSIKFLLILFKCVSQSPVTVTCSIVKIRGADESNLLWSKSSNYLIKLCQNSRVTYKKLGVSILTAQTHSVIFIDILGA